MQILLAGEQLPEVRTEEHGGCARVFVRKRCSLRTIISRGNRPPAASPVHCQEGPAAAPWLPCKTGAPGPGVYGARERQLMRLRTLINSI